jgi:hypothetical protein
LGQIGPRAQKALLNPLKLTLVKEKERFHIRVKEYFFILISK